MPSNLDRYREDFDRLLAEGQLLHHALQAECFRNEFLAEVEKNHGEKAEGIIKALPSFAGAYQHWYSEAKALIVLMLGSMFMLPFYSLRSLMPNYTSVFGMRLGLSLVLISTSISVLVRMGVLLMLLVTTD